MLLRCKNLDFYKQNENIVTGIMCGGKKMSHNKENKKVVSITEAAELNNVTRQAIYVAIKLNKLKATKETTRWTINVEDLEDYRRQKYSRTKSIFDGELLFDNHKGFYSVNQVAEMLKVPAQKIYYATRIGVLKAQRKGAAWVIHADDVKEYQEKHMQKKSRRRQAS
jgi:excisionase family DNA binding protein